MIWTGVDFFQPTLSTVILMVYTLTGEWYFKLDQHSWIINHSCWEG